MREDMFQVIIERPRLGSRSRHRPSAPKPGAEQPKYESMSRHRRGWKHLNENLAPLRRYLRSNVGRPWDKVYSEICDHLSVKSAVQQHVRDHLDDLVCRHVRETNGVLYEARWGTPLQHRLRRRDVLYVCPRTGQLRVLLYRSPANTQRAEYRWVDERTCYGKWNGAWFIFSLAPCLPRWDLAPIFGRRDVFVVSKRPLSRIEIRLAGLPRGR